MEDFSFLSENTFQGDSVPPLSFDFNSCDQFLSGLEASQGFYSTSTSSGSSPETHQLDANSGNNNNNTNSRPRDNGVTLLNGSYPSLSPEMLLNNNNNNNKPSPDNYNAEGFPQVNQDDYLLSLVSPSSMSGAEAGGGSSCEYSSDTHTSYTPDLKVEDSFSPSENYATFIPPASKLADNRSPVMMAKQAQQQQQQPPPPSLAINNNYNRTDSYARPPVVNGQLQSPHSSYASELSSKDASPMSNQDDDEQLVQIGTSNKLSSKNNALGVKDGKVSKPKKSPHNMVEKRYRTNINDKISALRDHVPSLRAALNQSKGAVNSEDLEGLSPANKLNKATILTKAMEYIEHLQKKNLMLTQENETLRQGRAFGNAGFQQQQQQQRPNNVDAIPQGSNRGGNNYVGKLMMGSMAGMMAFGTLSDFQQQSSSSQSMSAAPILLLNQAFSSYPILPTMLFYAKFLIFFGALIYIFAPSLFESRSNSKGKFYSNSTQIEADSTTEFRYQAWLTSSQCLIIPGSSSISKVRAILRNVVELVLQILVGSEAKRHVLRLGRTDSALRKNALETAIDAQLCGGDISCSQWRLVSTLLASASEPLNTRRAMTLAMHVQVVLFNHPDLERVARKISNHYWNLARSMYKNNTLELGQDINNEENKDMLLAPHLASLLECECDDVFNHDTVRKCHDLTWSTQKRKEANEKGNVNAYPGDPRLFDSALRLPLDALCDWHARGLLRKSLLQVLQGDVGIINDDALARVEIAKKIAPPYSFSQRHAYIVRAVFSSKPDESKYLQQVFTLLEHDAQDNLLAPLSSFSMSDSDNDTESNNSNDEGEETDNNTISASGYATPTGGSNNNNNVHRKLLSRISIKDEQSVSTSNFVTKNCFAGIRSAMIINACESGNFNEAGTAIDKLSVDEPKDMELLAFVSVWRAIKILTKASPVLISQHEGKLENIVGLLRVWIGGEQGDIEGIDVETRKKVSQECLDLFKRLGGIIGDDDSDEGYVTGGI